MSKQTDKLEAAVADLRTIAKSLRIPLDTSAVDAALAELVESLRPQAGQAVKPVKDFAGGEVRRVKPVEKSEA